MRRIVGSFAIGALVFGTKDSQDGARSGLAAATTASVVVSVTPAESADPVHMVARSHKDVSIH
ncbi:hypothetical protein ABZ260_46155 [Streptosporangium sp. NPDC006013]|uniref:hypothetical protein n=1 Tax=Streptosporangium sp. NPDC006013 TaxID=3155596 RepID=UPI0033BB355C